MARVDGWERRLKEVVEKHMALPSVYKISNCFIICNDAHEAVMGVKLAPETEYDLNYEDEQGALRRMVEQGYKSVEDILDRNLEEIAPSLAQRGDMGVVEVDGVVAGGVFTQIGFMTRGTKQVVFLPSSQVKKAYKVR